MNSPTQNPPRRALITGASGDIGAAICLRLAQQGLHIIAHANRQIERAQALAQQIENNGGSAQCLRFDITDAEATHHALEGLLSQGPIQVLVNNAGIYQDAPMAGMRREQWNRVIDVSLHGFFNVTQPLLLPMMATRWGRIITVSSISGVIGNRGQTNYAAAKAGLHGASKSLALELATRGITVNVVAPGLIAGRISDNEFSPEAIKQIIPMNRAGTPEEVAALVAFLASDEAAYISAQVININGAMA